MEAGKRSNDVAEHNRERFSIMKAEINPASPVEVRNVKNEQYFHFLSQSVNRPKKDMIDRDPIDLGDYIFIRIAREHRIPDYMAPQIVIVADKRHGEEGRYPIGTIFEVEGYSHVGLLKATSGMCLFEEMGTKKKMKMTAEDFDGLLMSPNDMTPIDTRKLHERVMEEMRKPENVEELRKSMARYQPDGADF